MVLGEVAVVKTAGFRRGVGGGGEAEPTVRVAVDRQHVQ